MDEMNIDGDNNVQIKSEGNVVSASGEGAIAAGGNITINSNIDHEIAKSLEEKLSLLESLLGEFMSEMDEENKKLLAQKITVVGKEMSSDRNLEFCPKKLLEIGNVSYFAGQMELAKGQYKQALKEFRQENEIIGINVALRGLANIANSQGNYNQAATYYMESYDLCVQHKLSHSLMNAILGLGKTAEKKGDYYKAEEWNSKGYKISKLLDSKANQAKFLGNLGVVYAVNGKLKEASEALESALLLKREEGDKYGEANTLLNLGNVSLKQKMLTAAKMFFEQSLLLRRELDDKTDSLADNLNNLGTINLMSGDLANAKKHLEEAAKIYQNIGNLSSYNQTMSMIESIRSNEDGRF